MILLRFSLELHCLCNFRSWLFQIMSNRNSSEAMEDFEIEVTEFYEYYGNTAVVLKLNLSESNSWNDISAQVLFSLFDELHP